MKHMIRGVLLFSILLGLPGAYSQTPKGVAGVTVTVKQSPAKRSVTDARGAFSFEGLPAGSYTLTFKAQKARDTKTVSTTTTIIATSYNIKVEGGSRPITQKLTSDSLIAGVDVPVQLGAGGNLRGQVMAGGLKKMVWIAPEVGSHFPGHWVDADSKEAAAHNTNRISNDDVRDNLQRPIDPHQEGFSRGVNSSGVMVQGK
jgi:hypothetical protein